MREKAMLGISLGKVIINRILARVALGGGLLIIGMIAVFGIQSGKNQLQGVDAKAIIFDMPLYNWYVCEDLGLGEVPGVDEPRVRLRLCHHQGYEILAYCLQPHLLAPPLDTSCANTTGDTYWCGDQYQLLSAYDIIVTPTPTATSTNTSTATATATQTTTPVSTDTPTPSPTSSPSPTTTLFQEEFPIAPTATARPGPGGKGNLGWISLGLLAGGTLVAISAGYFLPLTRVVSAKTKPEALELPFAHPQVEKRVRWYAVQKRWWLGLIFALLSAILGYWIAKKSIVLPGSLPTSSVRFPIESAPTQVVAFQFVNLLTSYPLPITQASSQSLQEVYPAQSFPLIDERIDFSPQGNKISLQIDPPNPAVNHGKPIELSFLPGDTCAFGDHQACVTSFEDSAGRHFFLSIHSGVGGEGQSFRHALEGTGINRAGYPLSRVSQHIRALQGAQVTITQDGDEIGGFVLSGLIRIPPAYLDAYLKQPVTQAVRFAASIDLSWDNAIDLTRPMLIFETCGWKMPSEPWLVGVTSTTGSIYLGVIQRLP